MKKCYNCGGIISFNETTCPYCKATLIGPENCPNCNTKLNPNQDYCSKCGELLKETKCPSCKKTLNGSPRICPYCETKLTI